MARAVLEEHFPPITPFASYEDARAAVEAMGRERDPRWRRWLAERLRMTPEYVRIPR